MAPVRNPEAVIWDNVSKLSLIENTLHIDNKEGIVVPLIANRMQRDFMLNKSSRNIVLKHRQGGLSSIYLSDMYTDCAVKEYMTCAVVSHETRATQRLLARVQSYHDSMDEPRPILDANSRSEKRFLDTHSSIYVGTAGAKAFGRGDTIRKVLLSELAFYENAEPILNGIEDSVPLMGEITIECTPNGEGNIFYDRWVKARSGRSPYKPFFYPWWFTDEYSIPINSPIALPADKGELSGYSRDELNLILKEGLQEDQIRWRRWKIGEKGGLFWQEYPEDELSCFITIGSPFFDINILNELASNCYPGDVQDEGWVKWLPVDSDAKVRYIISADSAAGSPGGSFSSFTVINDRYEVCATYQARVDPAVLSALLKKVGSYYNNAMVVIERNFTGYAVLEGLTDYANVYRQRDFLTGKVTTNLGWWTNAQTKEYMLSKMKECLHLLKCWDVNLVRQLRSYRYIKNKPVAQSFDDVAMALMIGIAVKQFEGGSRGFMGSSNSWGW
tara:strand:+ start:1090 stop:2592 length:1503 start_codon:yes stop_codon:yes gene_type:complete